MRNSSLPDVKFVNVNHRESWQSAVSRYFRTVVKQNSFKHLILSLVTLGVYPYKKYKHAKHIVAQALAARKLMFFKSLQEHTEKIRNQQHAQDPRQSLNAIFMKVQSEKVSTEEDALEFKAIYYLSELLLFITNPMREYKRIYVHRLKSRKHLDYLKMWHELKQKALINQYRQIQNINLCNKALKQEYCLTSTGIHDRLSRSSVCRKNPCLLTKFRELGKAFQEVVIAYQDFEELAHHHPELFHLIETLSKTSKNDIEILQTYLSSRHLPKDLPLQNRRQLIQLANQQEALYHVSEEEQFGLCALILNRYQWEFLLSIQEVSEVTVNLIDWAFETSATTIEKERSFLETVLAEYTDKVCDDPENFPNLNETIQQDPTLKDMTLDFAKELNREWPSLQLYEDSKLVYQMDKTDTATPEQLVEVYHEMQKMSAKDDVLFIALQQAFSQCGKQAFQTAIEQGMFKLLGEKSEYFLPIFSNSNIAMMKQDTDHIVICYAFEQVILKKGEVKYSHEQDKYMMITQPLIKQEGQWISPAPQVEVAAKKRTA